MNEKTASWWADEVIRRMEADPNTDLAPVAVGQMITAQVFAEAIAAAEERGRREVEQRMDGYWSDERVQVEIREAEERGRRSGVEERDGLRALLAEVRSWILAADRNHLGRRELLARIDAALAPRDSAPDTHGTATGICPRCSFRLDDPDFGKCPGKPASRDSGKEGQR